MSTMMATVRKNLGVNAQAFSNLTNGFSLSQRFKGAFKTALALVITYGIALSMGWKNPFWAAYAVAFCSLATAGESLHKGLLRVAGTFVAFFLTLALISLFPQDRWLFLGSLSLYLAFCNYMMGGTSRWYFWQVAAFTVPLLAFGAGPEVVNAFDKVVLRAQMTTLGIVVYSVVSVLLWPTSTRALFEGTVEKLASGQHNLFRSYFAQQGKKNDDDDLRGLRNQVVKGAGALEDLLNGAEIESLEVWEVRHAWRQCIRQFGELNTRLDRWQHSLDKLHELDVERMVPGLPGYMAEIDTRFGQIEQMLSGSPPTAQLCESSLRLDSKEGSQLSHFHRAAIVLAINQLQEIGRLTQALFNNISSIRGFATEQKTTSRAERPRLSGTLDLDRIASVVRMLSTLWLALLIWIYLPDLPAYSVLLNLTVSISLSLLIMPQVRAPSLVKPLFLSILFAAVVHIFVMPRLDGFMALALLIFTVTFALGYLYAQPHQKLSKIIGFAMFFLLTSVDTVQVYNFTKIANIALAFALLLGLIALTTYFPISFQPEKRFLHLLRRFFRSGEYLVATASLPANPWGLESRRRAFHLHEVMTIPRKLASWGGGLSRDALDKTSPAQLQAILNSLETLGWHVQELTAAREEVSSNAIPHDLNNDLQAWRTSIEMLFARFSSKPDAEDHATLRKALDGLLERIEEGIEETLDSADSRNLTPENEMNVYQLLGAYRGLSEALVTYASCANYVNWPRLAEDRF